MRVSCNVNISKISFKDLNKYIRWFWKKELSGNKTQEKIEPEDKVLALNARENKWNSNNGKLLKVKCNKCGKYVHRASGCLVNSNKVNDNRNKNKNNRKPCFNGECNNFGKISHQAVYCWTKKGKDKYYDIKNLFMEATFYK